MSGNSFNSQHTNADAPINIWKPVFCRVCDVLFANTKQLLYHFEDHIKEGAVLSPVANGAPMYFGSQIGQIRPYQSTFNQNAIVAPLSKKLPIGTITIRPQQGVLSNCVGGPRLRSERNNFKSSMELNPINGTLPLLTQLEKPFEDATKFCCCQENEDVNLDLTLKL
nr:hypothetical protein A4A49_53445 [Ipomoea batatas]